MRLSHDGNHVRQTVDSWATDITDSGGCASQNCTCWGVSRRGSDDDSAVAEPGMAIGSDATAGGVCAAPCALVLAAGSPLLRTKSAGAYTENLRHHSSYLLLY